MQKNNYKSKIYYVRGQSVMLDRDLCEFYETDLKIFNKAMKRRKEDFEDITFELSNDEYQEILALNKEVRTSRYNPIAYTEKAAYKMAFILSSKTSLKVADLILDVFISVREGKYLPKEKDNKIMLLESRISKLEMEMQGKQVQNNFHAPVTLIQGNDNSVTIGSKEDVILKIIEVMNNKEVVLNENLSKLLRKAMDQATKKDKPGLLVNLKSIIELAPGVEGIATKIHYLIDLVSKFF